MIKPMTEATNDHIEKYLDYYIGKIKPQYAIMIDGDWGAGKTWFIDKYKESKTETKFLYVSLYGLNTTTEIEDKFYSDLHPILSSKAFSLGTKIFKGFLKGAIKIDLNNDGREDGTLNASVPDLNLPDYLDNTDGYVLIFDDLERCGINHETLLGYINSFVEHLGQKVILLANKKEIKDLDKYMFFLSQWLPLSARFFSGLVTT
jgi:hypothetical protein